MSKRQKKEPLQSVLTAGYQNHSYVIHGLAQLDTLIAMVSEATNELVATGDFDNIEFAFIRKQEAKMRAALEGMDETHAKMSKLLQSKGYRKIVTEDWVDINGNPLGVGRR